MKKGEMSSTKALGYAEKQQPTGVRDKGEIRKLVLTDWRKEASERKKETKAWIKKRGYRKDDCRNDFVSAAISHHLRDDSDHPQITIRLDEIVMSHGIIGNHAYSAEPESLNTVKFEICR